MRPEANLGATQFCFRPSSGASGQASGLALLGESLVKIDGSHFLVHRFQKLWRLGLRAESPLKP